MNPIVFVVLTAILIGGAFYLVALPILQHARRASAPPSFTLEQERLDDLIASRDAMFQALRELNFDHRVGKITDEDFMAFEAHLKHNAAESLRALDEWEKEADEELDRIVERAVRARKQYLASEGGAERRPADYDRICAKCGRPASIADRYCGGCGAPLPEGAAREPTPVLACPTCGQPYHAEDRFCAGCGQTLAVDDSTERAAA